MKIRTFCYCIFTFALISSFAFLSCQQQKSTSQLVIGVTGDVDSFNPLLTRSRFGAELSKMLYIGLLEEQPDFVTFKPALARSWSFEDSGKRIRFNLRTDVFWSDSVKVTAADVEFTHSKQVDELIGWTGASVKSFISAVQVVNDSTIDFIFTEIYPYQLMDANEGVILPRHIFENVASTDWQSLDYTKHFISSGPYKLKTWAPNQYIELTRNELYYNPALPKINTLIFKQVPDQTQLLTQLQTGEINVLEGVPAQDAVQIAAENKNITIEHFPYSQYVQVSWNMQKPLFQERRVRQALTMAIDRQSLVEHLLQGFGQVCNGPIHTMLWASNPDLPIILFSVDSAKAQLSAAGWADTDNDGYLDKNKQPFEFQLMTNIGSQVREDALVMIQEMLKDVGIKVVPQRLEWSVYVEKLTARDYDAVLIGMMSATKVDVFPVWHSSMCGADGFNLSCYKNTHVDSLIEKARQLADRDSALPLWYEFQEILVQDQPATFLWIPERLVGFDTHIRGFIFSPVSTFFNVAEWYYQ
ncbi:MAG TPA: ABC transporter substrate-binding protein [bacterium]|nr:ABC transporter substrate-binding protein [bacterium]HPN44807.1 ABC transporter substrate-binding protein [bacterium]